MVKRKQKISQAERARRSRQARKNFGLTRTKRRSVNKVVKKRRSVKRRSSGKVQIFDMEAMIYGALRDKVSGFVRQNASQIPIVGGLIGQFGDEVAMGGVDFLLIKRKIGGPMVQRVARKGLIVENARVGANLGAGFSLGGATSAPSTEASANINPSIQ